MYMQCINNTNTHAPDKLAFLAGSDQAMLFLYPLFYPGQTNDEMSEWHLHDADKITVSQLSLPPEKCWPDAYNTFKDMPMDEPDFQISFSSWIILNREENTLK